MKAVRGEMRNNNNKISNIQKKNNNIANLSPSLSIITLYINRFKISIQKTYWQNGLKKSDAETSCQKILILDIRIQIDGE